MSNRKTETTFIGIDLAWGNRNPTAVVALRRGRLCAYQSGLMSLDAIADFVGDHLSAQAGTIVAVDAPLRVPNLHGSRPCERELNAEWRRFEAGTHPANRTLLGRDGAVRGELLVELLVQRYRFAEATTIPRRSSERLLCEVYPHPAHIALFGLEKTLKYKRGPVDARRLELARYQKYLRTLRKAKPALKKTKALLTRTAVSELRGRALKSYEDTLDALTCAYIAYYLWWHGPSRARTYGTLTEGHIITPMPQKMARQLAGPSSLQLSSL